jgi:hypothetical protein
MSRETSDDSYADIEAELSQHPMVRECAIAEVEVGPGRTYLIAYVVTEHAVGPLELQNFLTEPRIGHRRAPSAFVPVTSLPRTPDGRLSIAELPQPVQVRQSRSSKGGTGYSYTYPPAFWPQRAISPSLGIGVLVLPMAIGAFVLAKIFWPNSTDLTGVPQPWAALFFLLYLAECLAFGLGIGFLAFGRPAVQRLGRSRFLTTMAHLAISWWLVAWWPQDTAYRLASKTDWPRQAVLVYSFNITLMIAAAVLVAFATASPANGLPDPRRLRQARD